jgi:hypothetical protein
MILSRSDQEKPTVEGHLKLLRKRRQELEEAYCQFEELWEASRQGEKLPSEKEVKAALKRLRFTTEGIELSFMSLRLLHDFPSLTQARRRD